MHGSVAVSSLLWNNSINIGLRLLNTVGAPSICCVPLDWLCVAIAKSDEPEVGPNRVLWDLVGLEVNLHWVEYAKIWNENET